MLPSFLGKLAPVLFAIALIAAGQSSTVTGTLAGQIIMEGYLSLRINPMLRRLITRLLAIIPALLVILIYGEQNTDALLILSQVILSLQLGFAIIPLIHFVSDKNTMGNFAIKTPAKIAAWCIAAVLIFLNLKMLLNEMLAVFRGGSWWLQALVVAGGLLCLVLLLYIIIHPFVSRHRRRNSIKMHPDLREWKQLTVPAFTRIAIAVDFSGEDERLLAAAIGQGKENSTFLLIHVVESASAGLHGRESDDYETREDKERMQLYVSFLQERGFRCEGYIGYRNRAKEIVRIVKELNADILVMGSHGHTALKDFIYGHTVNTVRHELKIPVLIVTL